jgi:hypothetical protein
MNKRGGIGDFISMIISIIAIALILGAFILVSTPYIKFSEKPAAVVDYSQKELERDFFNYSDGEHIVALESRFELRKELGVG